MIKNYKIFTESLLGNMKGPTNDEIINSLKDKDIERLLDLGIQQNSFEMVKSAIENGAEIDYRINNPLVKFGLSKNWERIKLYMDSNISLNSNYKSLLKNYAHINDTRILSILVQDCDVKNIGDVALKTACFNNSYEAVQLLIDNGVDVNAYNDYLLRELIIYKYPNYKMIKLLLDNGANPHVNNDSLFKCPVPEIVDLLKKY